GWRPISARHGRACPGHPRLACNKKRRGWPAINRAMRAESVAECWSCPIPQGMPDMKLPVAAATLLLVAAIATLTGARAETYPSRPITIVVPFPAGGSTGVLARILADPMQAGLGQAVIIGDIRGAG